MAATLAMFERWLKEREMILAKLDCSLEAPRNPAVAEVLSVWRGRLVGVVDAMISQAAGSTAWRGRRRWSPRSTAC